MSSGMAIFTFVHVALSLVGIVAGFVVVFGLISGKPLGKWTALFLTTTLLTTVTGFLFPFHKFLPSHAIGILSLIVLAIAIYALYGRRLAGAWRRSYVITSVIALYFNVFVLVAQLFLKVPALKAIAPTQSETPFKLAQLSLLALFVFLATFAAIKFRIEQPRRA
jgi:hypothetical protein